MSNQCQINKWKNVLINSQKKHIIEGIKSDTYSIRDVNFQILAICHHIWCAGNTLFKRLTV